MAMASFAHGRVTSEVVLFECFVFPGAFLDHVSCQLSLQLLLFQGELGPFRDLIRLIALNVQMLTLLIVVKVLLGVAIGVRVCQKLVKLHFIGVNWIINSPLITIPVFFDPLILHSFALSNLGELLANATFHTCKGHFLAHLHIHDKLELGRAIDCVALTLFGEFNLLPLDDVQAEIVESN